MSQAFKSEFLNIMQDRGFIHQATDLEGLDEKMSSGPISAYIGFDCTGPSLHVGSLVQIMMLRWLQKTGHTPVVLLGGGTSRVGDPSGKDESRKMLSEDQIDANTQSINGIFHQFLEFDGPAKAVPVNNWDWLNGLGYISFLRDYGPHFTVNRMLTFDSVKLRLDREQPLTFLEFNYMILQSYDFLELARRKDCLLQLGGSDQWGNIVSGIELARRVDGRSLFGLTTALITTADGKKMGKTEQGAIWLNEAQLSSYDYWQFWRNVQDADVGRFLRLFTDMPLDEIARLEKLEGAEINEAKVILANEATKMCRGEQAAIAAQKTAHETFVKGGAGQDLPRIILSNTDIEGGIGILDLFTKAGLTKSNSEARRLIKQRGAKLNDTAIENDELKITAADFASGDIKLSAGKKRHAIIAAN